QAQRPLTNIADPHAARTRILERQSEIIDLANAVAPKLVEVGGGVTDLEVRHVEAQSTTYVLVHLLVDVRDATGANAVNTMAEAVSSTVSAIAEGDALLRILTIKTDRSLCRARAVIDMVLPAWSRPAPTPTLSSTVDTRPCRGSRRTPRATSSAPSRCRCPSASSAAPRKSTRPPARACGSPR